MASTELRRSRTVPLRRTPVVRPSHLELPHCIQASGRSVPRHVPAGPRARAARPPHVPTRVAGAKGEASPQHVRADVITEVTCPSRPGRRGRRGHGAV